MSYLPIRDIRIRTARLELRLPDLELLDELAAVADAGIHPPEEMPFGVPWTDSPSPGRGTVQFHLRQLADWNPKSWSFNPVVLDRGRVVGTQGISASDFAVTRDFSTGSWLGAAHQGRGIGKEMRAAILHFGFVGLGAQTANSSAFRDNLASLAVSRSLGYAANGERSRARRGACAQFLELRLTRERWQLAARPEVQIEGLEPCLEWFLG
ncbi:MAG: GNAT family N-acetyltransferase [Candidatus Dormibacteria bacterium]